MARATSLTFIDKSVAAAVSAIGVYNQPDFKYREETFAILMVNAWELLLKGRILALNKNKLSSIYAWEFKKKIDGTRSKVQRLRRNRADNPLTIGIQTAMDRLVAAGDTVLLGACRENINLLIEIRDNAIHFRHADLGMGKKVQEIGTAGLRNYVALIEKWFGYDLSRYNFYLMPLSFFHAYEAESHSLNTRTKQVANLIAYIARQEVEHPSDPTTEFNVSLRLETRFVKSASPDAMPFARTGDPSHITINISEEDALKRYPLSYRALTDLLRKRYTNFLANSEYHTLRQKLVAEPRFCRIRLLDPRKPRGLRKEFFSTEIIKEFDKHYDLRRSPRTGASASD